MAETPNPETEPQEIPPHSAIARVRLRAKYIGDETADQVAATLSTLPWRTGSMVGAAGRAAEKAELEELRRHGL